MIQKIEFENYKGFKDPQEIEIKPITLLIGKNSSGKSSICKLIPILAEGFDHPEDKFPLVSSDGVRLSHTYQDLFHNGDYTSLIFRLTGTDSVELSYLMDDGKFYNKDVRKNVFCPENTPKELTKDSVTYLGPIRNHDIEFLNKYDVQNQTRPDGRGGETYGELLRSFLSDGVLLEKVGNWFDQNMSNQKLTFKEVAGKFGLVAPLIKRDKVEIHISEVGEGVTQVLPVIVKSFEDIKDRLVILEQPALHLHPSIHFKISERLVKSTQETGQKFLIESHSKTLLLGFVRLITQPDSGFSKDDIAIYYLDSDEAPFSVKKIEVYENGDFDWWPNGLFEDDYELQEQIINQE